MMWVFWHIAEVYIVVLFLINHKNFIWHLGRSESIAWTTCQITTHVEGRSTSEHNSEVAARKRFVVIENVNGERDSAGAGPFIIQLIYRRRGI
jgi:hypothetical protein